jgi:hypothetical protein
MNNPAAFFRFLIAVVLAGTYFSNAAFARDASFLNPGASGIGIGEEAVKVDPKADIEVGETAINVEKRATIFFVNQTNAPIKIEKIALSSDSLVTAEETANDCTKQGIIAPLSRCSVEVSVTPSGSGTWSVDVLMTHDGAGRITRARLFGKTSGSGSSENKVTGLSVSSKEIKPVDFGSVNVNGGKVVRSTLMVNDSPDPIKIYSIDVIEADNGLQQLKDGCAVDMELAPGASCPVTLLWEPKEALPISTDLIIRHSGKLGFSVIPIRGEAKGGTGMMANSGGGSGNEGASALSKSAVPMPLSARELEKEVAGKIQPVSGAALESGKPATEKAKPEKKDTGNLYLIGTIGDRALFLLPTDETSLVATGDNFETDEGTAKLIKVRTHSVDIMVGGKQTTLMLEAAPEFVSKALDQAKTGGNDAKSGPDPIVGIKR